MVAKSFYILQLYSEGSGAESPTLHQNLGGDEKLSDDSLPGEAGRQVGGGLHPLMFLQDHRVFWLTYAAIPTLACMDVCTSARKPWQSCSPTVAATPQFSPGLIFMPDCYPWPQTFLSQLMVPTQLGWEDHTLNQVFSTWMGCNVRLFWKTSLGFLSHFQSLDAVSFSNPANRQFWTF